MWVWAHVGQGCCRATVGFGGLIGLIGIDRIGEEGWGLGSREGVSVREYEGGLSTGDC